MQLWKEQELTGPYRREGRYEIFIFLEAETDFSRCDGQLCSAQSFAVFKSDL